MVGTLIGLGVAAIVAIVLIVVVRRRRARSTRAATSQRLAELHTSYDSLKAAMTALDAGDNARALAIGEQLFAASALGPYTVPVAHLVVGEAAAKVGAHRTAMRHLPKAIEATRRGALVAPLSELLRMQARAKAGLCEFDDAIDLAREARYAARVTRDRARSLVLEGEIHMERGDLPAAEAALGEALDALDGQLERAAADHLAGRIFAAQNDLERAVSLLTTAQARYERSTNPVRAAKVMADLAEVTEQLGDPAKAAGLMRSALDRIEGPGYDRSARAVMLVKAAGIEAATESIAAAERHLEEATKLFEITDVTSAAAYLDWGRARIAAARGDVDAARATAWRAEEEAARLGMGAWRDKLRRERESDG
jgi:tetratricopeptide (TPR) repeat protein